MITDQPRLDPALNPNEAALQVTTELIRAGKLGNSSTGMSGEQLATEAIDCYSTLRKYFRGINTPI